jgi:hypothetical protein
MKLDWNEFTGKTLHVTMLENYGMVYDEKSNSPLYEIVFKTGKLTGVFEEGLMLETTREGQRINIYIPYHSIKCVEIFNV